MLKTLIFNIYAQIFVYEQIWRIAFEFWHWWILKLKSILWTLTFKKICDLQYMRCRSISKLIFKLIKFWIWSMFVFMWKSKSKNWTFIIIFLLWIVLIIFSFSNNFFWLQYRSIYDHRANDIYAICTNSEMTRFTIIKIMNRFDRLNKNRIKMYDFFAFLKKMTTI